MFIVKNGDGELIKVAYTPKEVWDAWNESGCFSSEHWDCLRTNNKKNNGKKRKVSTMVNNDGTPKYYDERVFRGWKNSIVSIGGINCVLEALIPPYLREPNCASRLPDGLKDREDLNDPEFGPFSMTLLQSLKDRDDNLIIQRDTVLGYLMQMHVSEIKVMKNVCEIILRTRGSSNLIPQLSLPAPTASMRPSSSGNRPYKRWRTNYNRLHNGK